MSINDVNTKGFIRWIDMNERKKRAEHPMGQNFLINVDKEKPVDFYRVSLSTF